MQLSEMIGKRRSVRKYTAEAVDADILRRIEEFFTQAKPLYPTIGVRMEVIGAENVRSMFSWMPQQVVAIFSEEKEGYLENAGFLLQQVDLFLQSQGLGSCWLGMGKLNPDAENKKNDGLKFVIMLAFGAPDGELYRDAAAFKRKPLSDIADEADARLEPARLAPSSVNSQPWYFTREGEVYHAYCSKQGLLKMFALGQFNRIDMGIALAHMYVSNPQTFRFFQADNVKEIKGHRYTGSFTL